MATTVPGSSRLEMRFSRKEDSFHGDKARALAQTDLSRKGSIDAAILDLVVFLNARDAYYTTSSCSGRLLAFSQGSAGQRKRGCRWLLSSHTAIETAQLISALESVSDTANYVYFKFEPFILHLMCQTLDHARTVLQVAVACGFRNSGITFGKKGRIMIAVRSTHSLETPVAHDGKLIVTEQYLAHVVAIANEKMANNLDRVAQFHHGLQRVLVREPLSTTDKSGDLQAKSERECDKVSGEKTARWLRSGEHAHERDKVVAKTESDCDEFELPDCMQAALNM